MLSRVGEPELVSTPVAARRLGVSARSVTRWRKKGLVTPDLVTPGGQMRWDVERLRRQIDALRDD